MQKLSLSNPIARHTAALELMSIRAGRQERGLAPSWRKAHHALESRCMSNVIVARQIGVFDEVVILNAIAKSAKIARLAR